MVFQVVTGGILSFFPSIYFLSLKDLDFPSTNCPVSKSFSSGQFPPKLVSSMFWLAYYFCFCSIDYTNDFIPVNSKGIC